MLSNYYAPKFVRYFPNLCTQGSVYIHQMKFFYTESIRKLSVSVLYLSVSISFYANFFVLTMFQC